MVSSSELLLCFTAFPKTFSKEFIHLFIIKYLRTYNILSTLLRVKKTSVNKTKIFNLGVQNERIYTRLNKYIL